MFREDKTILHWGLRSELALVGTYSNTLSWKTDLTVRPQVKLGPEKENVSSKLIGRNIVIAVTEVGER